VETQGLGTTTVTQVAIIVRDIEARVQAWAAVLGMPVPEIIVTDPVEVAQTEYQGAPSPGRAKLAFFKLGQVSLELIEPIDGPSTWKDQLDQHGESLHHIAFNVEGMGERIAHLAAHGAPLVQRGEYTGGRYAYVDGTSALGAVVELLENDRRPA
jgi:catechol 2,3-dioxygenase-like lactoylglutathione lyase family enzyme